MTNHKQPTNLLGEEIAKRLKQLTISRREFSRRFKLSRQTLYALEHGSGKAFAASTFEAIDRGLKWPTGTAKGFYDGIANAKDISGGSSKDELVRAYIAEIVKHVYVMSIDELEREVLMLEEEAFGRPLPDTESVTVIRETVARLSNAMLNGPLNRGQRIKDGIE
jgi:transcriptional regulator with XRE-family HTH domain